MIRSFLILIFLSLFAHQAVASEACHSFLKHKMSEFVITAANPADGGIDAFYNGESVAYIQFEFEESNSTLDVASINVDHGFRWSGLSKVLLAEALRLHPKTKTIKTSLTQTNELVFRQVQLAGLSFDSSNPGQKMIEAIKQTPAYKIRAALGFGKISKLVNEHYWIVLHVERDDQ